MESIDLGNLEELPWVIFRLQGQNYAVVATDVREMLALPQVTPVPRAPDFIRGMINLRGEVIPLVDLRRRMNLKSAAEEIEEFIQTLQGHKQDHLRWLEALVQAVEEKRPFTLATDPHQCAFGKWYDAYTTEDVQIMDILQRFDSPHKSVHAVGNEVNQLIAKGRYDEAHEVIERARKGPFERMLNLFTELSEAIRKSHFEIALVLDKEGVNIALAVDAVESVELLAPGTVEDLPGTYHGEKETILTKIGRRKEDNDSVIILDVGILLKEGFQTKALLPTSD
jgi:purine-binding chemotaxis protein CheW